MAIAHDGVDFSTTKVDKKTCLILFKEIILEVRMSLNKKPSPNGKGFKTIDY
jgi:hypothetical protein